MGKQVLVTGASGFIAQQLIIDLRDAGHAAQVRGIGSSEKVKALLGRDLIAGREAIVASGETLIEHGAVRGP